MCWHRWNGSVSCVQSCMDPSSQRPSQIPGLRVTDILQQDWPKIQGLMTPISSYFPSTRHHWICIFICTDFALVSWSYPHPCCISHCNQKSGTTARTKLAQSDAPPTVLDTSPCQGGIQGITPAGIKYANLTQSTSQTCLEKLSLSQVHPRFGGTPVPIQGLNRP